MSELAHLVRRFRTSLSSAPPSADDESWALSWLHEREAVLWLSMSNVDRRHATLVARRFVERRPDASRPEVVGALLHDVGKVQAGLGTFARVVATIVGPRTERFRAYHDHEAIGAAMLAEAGSDPITVELVQGRGDAASALRAADHV